ncbi:hypothetical protein OSTOST_14488, partial [Ostertagia ostertagi]
GGGDGGSTGVNWGGNQGGQGGFGGQSGGSQQGGDWGGQSGGGQQGGSWGGSGSGANAPEVQEDGDAKVMAKEAGAEATEEAAAVVQEVGEATEEPVVDQVR